MMMAGPIGAKPCDDQPLTAENLAPLDYQIDCVCESMKRPPSPSRACHTTHAYTPCPPSPAPQKTLLGTHTLMLHERKELRYHLELINLTYCRVSHRA